MLNDTLQILLIAFFIGLAFGFGKALLTPENVTRNEVMREGFGLGLIVGCIIYVVIFIISRMG